VVADVPVGVVSCWLCRAVCALELESGCATEASSAEDILLWDKRQGVVERPGHPFTMIDDRDAECCPQVFDPSAENCRGSGVG
jgi:hypothetical protein